MHSAPEGHHQARAQEEQGFHVVGAVVHVALALLASSLLNVLGTCVETIASLSAPAQAQGVAMGALNTALSIGALSGHLAGMGLWSYSLQLSGHGRKPSASTSWLAWVWMEGR